VTRLFLLAPQSFSDSDCLASFKSLALLTTGEPWYRLEMSNGVGYRVAIASISKTSLQHLLSIHPSRSSVEPNKEYRVLHGNGCSQGTLSSHIALTHREARYYKASLRLLPWGASIGRLVSSMTDQSAIRKSNITADH
jgi:hypothetical protein